MKHLKSFVALIVMVWNAYGATLHEECYDMRIKVREALYIYDRIHHRVIKNKKQYQSTLEEGYLNRTLLSEIERDARYLELSTSILHRLSHLKETLDYFSRKYANVSMDDKRNILPQIKILTHKHESITDILMQIKDLINQHERVFKQTLMHKLN